MIEQINDGTDTNDLDGGPFLKPSDSSVTWVGHTHGEHVHGRHNVVVVVEPSFMVLGAVSYGRP